MSRLFDAGRELALGKVRLRINWLVLACVLLTAFTFIRLGQWQLQRATIKLEQQSALEIQQRENPLPLETLEISDDSGSQDYLSDLHVVLQGEYQNQHTILVLAQFHEGQIGYEVVTPFRQQDSQSLVLVSRGWTTGILPPDTPPQLRPLAGLQRVTAQIHIPDPEERIIPSQIDAAVWPLRVRAIEPQVLAQILGENLFPYVVRLTPDQPGVLVRHWPAVNADINQHLSYALQWFTFAAITLLVSLLLGSNLLTLLRDSRH